MFMTAQARFTGNLVGRPRSGSIRRNWLQAASARQHQI